MAAIVGRVLRLGYMRRDSPILGRRARTLSGTDEHIGLGVGVTEAAAGSNEGGTLDLGRYWVILRTRWLSVLGGVVVGVAVAAGYAALTPTSFTATAMVNLAVIADQPFNSQRSASGLIDASTEAQLARSSAVLTDVAADMGGDTTIADVRHAMTVMVLPDTTVAKITYTAPTLDAAVAGADALSVAFVDYRTVAAQDKVDRIKTRLTDQQNSVSKELTVVNRAVAEASSGAQRAAAVSRRAILETQLGTLLDQLSQIDSIDTSGGSVITRAEDNAVGVQPHTRLLLQIGLAAGVVLGVLAAFVVNLLDRRVTAPTDLASARGGPLLAQLTDRAALVPAPAADADAYRAVAERLLADGETTRRAVTVVDLTARTRPAAAANLALGLVEAGAGPVLVVLDDAEGELATTLVEDHLGRRTASPMPTVGATAVRLGTPTRTGDAPAFDYLVVALSPGASRSTVLAAARRTGAALTIVERRRTSMAAVRSTVEDLATVGGMVTGTVLTARGRRRGRGRRHRRRVAADRLASVPAADGV